MRYPSQKVEQNRGHYCGLPGSDGATRNPSQEVEQSRGRYCGLPGSDGAAQNLLQEVEQSRSHYCGLLGGPGLSVEVRSESGLHRSPDGDHLSRSLGQGLSVIEIRKEFVHNGSSGEGLRWESSMDRSW